MINKIRVYLDTSVISYLDQQDMPDRMKETQEVWEILKSPEYQVIISSLVIAEIDQCKEEKQEILHNFLKQLNYERYEVTDDDVALANVIINEDVLKPKSIDDATHIAAALSSNANIILSWNFKHLVNYKTINGIRRICLKENINKTIDICSPYILLENED